MSQYFSPKSVEYFSSGSTLLDCVLGGGWPVGRVVNLVGDRSSGKSLLAIEACVNMLIQHPEANLYYIDAEHAFDESYITSLGIPVDRFKFINAFTLEDVINKLEEKIINANPKHYGIIVIDSYDSLSDEKELERLPEEGSYKTDKVRLLGEYFRKYVGPCEQRNITTFVINQVRDKIGARFPIKIKTGGHTLDHNSSQIVWLEEREKLTKTVNGVERPYALLVRAKCTKNKVGMPYRECEMDLTLAFGIDEPITNIRWLASIGKPYKGIDKGGIKNFAKKMQDMADEEYNKVREETAALVKQEWAITEEGFKPKRTKYNMITSGATNETKE